MNETVQLTFHLADAKKGIVPIPLESDFVIKKESKTAPKTARNWQPVVQQIRDTCEAINKNSELKIQASTECVESIADPQPRIHVLFIEPALLSARRFLDHLPGSPLRPVIEPDDRQFDSLGIFNPILSISLEDFPFADSQPDWREKKAGDPATNLAFHALPNSLNFDRRAHFLDSSIWHRYVPLLPAPKNERFALRHGEKTMLTDEGNRTLPIDQQLRDCLADTLTELRDYWTDELYRTVPAVSTLDFQLRMLRQSYIGRFGQYGHDALVIPFKFHSERFLKFMSRRTGGVAEFFREKKWNNKSLLESLDWNCLVVDDFADEVSKISTVDERKFKPRISKSSLLRRPLERLYVGEKIDNSKEKFRMVAPPGAAPGIVDICLHELKKQPFDLIFLDYLLGKRTTDNTAHSREYGYEFLQALIADNRLEIPQLRRDFLGKQWIFPISSFPFALPDKLSQLGISHFQSIWHLSQGADPITTPLLFEYSLLRFLRQKTREFFLDERALELIFNQAPNQPNLADPAATQLWAGYLHHSLQRYENLLNLLDKQVEVASTPFSKSIYKFVETHTELKELVYRMQVMAGNLEKLGGIDSKSFAEAEKSLAEKGFSVYQKNVQQFLATIKSFPKEMVLHHVHEVKCTIFCSRSNDDNDELKTFKKHLSSLKKRISINFWDKEDILGGANLENAISQQYDDTHIFIFLLSPDLISELEYDVYVEAARKKRFRQETVLLPIRLKSHNLDECLLLYQHLPKSGKFILSHDKNSHDEIWTEVVQDFESIIQRHFPNVLPKQKK